MPTCVPVCNCCFDVTSVLAHCIKVVFFSTCRKAKAKILVLCHRACVPMTVGDARATTSNFLRSVPNGSICGCFNVCLFCLCLCAADHGGRWVVRDSRMWCPHDIGRDSWVWGEQEALKMMNSPHELGDEAPIERSPCREEAGWPLVENFVSLLIHTKIINGSNNNG